MRGLEFFHQNQKDIDEKDYIGENAKESWDHVDCFDPELLGGKSPTHVIILSASEDCVGQGRYDWKPCFDQKKKIKLL